jgi:putative molybdopterin biosynthesis protein
MSQVEKRSSIYLHDIPLEKAWAVFIEALEKAGMWGPLEVEEIPLENALGRILAEPVWAKVSSPHYHAAAMDGYALRSAETDSASDRTPITLLLDTQAVYVDTGDPMPDWADAVVPIEHVEPQQQRSGKDGQDAILIRAALAPWTHVRPMGEDMIVTELILPEGQELRPVDIGAIAGGGHARVKVWRQPRVAIIPTGSELVQPGTQAHPGQIIEYNSLVLAAQVEAWGGQAKRFQIIPDDLDRIEACVVDAAQEIDLILVNAGSSAGSEDYTARVVQSLGTLLVHGVAIRPGHPVILGMIRRMAPASVQENDPTESEKSVLAGDDHAGVLIPIIGVPGYPVSTVLTGEIFVEPLITRWSGRSSSPPEMIEANLTQKVHSTLGDDEFLRVTLGRVGDRLVAAPLSRGAGVITSLLQADGIVSIPAGVQGLQAGAKVDVRLYRSIDEIERTILVLGSHDLTLDLMTQNLAQQGIRLSSANLGSVGGLIALRRHEAHLAGSHLLDPESGEYNLPYIREYMPGIATVVLALVIREQGLIITRGNPKGLEGIQDLMRDDLRFINRQRGAGTRIILDYHLDQLGISAESIRGYEREEYSHLAVAAAVASGRADCGLGIHAAADALDLHFVPLFKERYDFVIPKVHYESQKLAPLLGLLHTEDFKRQVDIIPGYDANVMGDVVAELT